MYLLPGEKAEFIAMKREVIMGRMMLTIVVTCKTKSGLGTRTPKAEGSSPDIALNSTNCPKLYVSVPTSTDKKLKIMMRILKTLLRNAWMLAL